MASAEARAPRSSNCEFVQEDRRKASESSCCPSSSSKSETSCQHCNAVNKSDHPIPGCIPRMPYNWKYRGHQYDFSHEQLNAVEISDYFDEIVNLSGENLPIKENGTQANAKSIVSSSPNQPCQVSSTCMKNEQDPQIQEPKGLIISDFGKVPKNKDMGEFWYTDEHLRDLDSFNLASQEPEKLCTDFASHWIGAERAVPWWRAADKDELASLVCLKSLEHVENCDLPCPRTENFGRAASAFPQYSYHSRNVDSSSDQMADKGISNLAETQYTMSNVGDSPLGSSRPFRSTSFSNNGPYKTNIDKAETSQGPEDDLSKKELLEALCHSQTRAREAEKAAQAAYDEKEHIVTLFLREASHLFAYRQWLQILQLENLCLQLKNKDPPTSAKFPAFSPWVPLRRRQMRKGRHKAANRTIRSPRNKIYKYAVAFAVGLSLAGAGLFLGWTMGWFFPAL